MKAQTSAFAILSAVLASTGLSAQTFHTAPFGFHTVEGRDNNTIPWWSMSGTYQQVHDASDLTNVFGQPFAVITSINFRKDNSTAAAPGRTMDAQVSMGLTSVNAVGAGSSFAANIGPSPQICLPFTNVNLPTLTHTSVPNPIGWSFPFTAPFVFSATGGNLCWELRYTNSSSNAFVACDAVGRLNTEVEPNVGLGCLATGQSQAAAIGDRSLSMQTGAWRNRLVRGGISAPVVQLIGFGHSTTPLPGFCTNLEFLPITSLSSLTDGAGEWDSTLTFGNLYDVATVDIMAQFAWVDGGLPSGVGLSDASLIRLPADSIRNISRIYAVPYQGGLGSETATSGSRDLRYGLVTIFGQ